jgi:hypothetical protein
MCWRNSTRRWVLPLPRGADLPGGGSAARLCHCPPSPFALSTCASLALDSSPLRPSPTLFGTTTRTHATQVVTPPRHHATV